MSENKPWLRFNAQGVAWEVHMTHVGDPRLDGNEGVTHRHAHIVFLDETLALDARMAILGHELGHVLLASTNDELTAAVLHCPKEDVTDAEEALCAYVGPTLGEILAQLATQLGGRA